MLKTQDSDGMLQTATRGREVMGGTEINLWRETMEAAKSTFQQRYKNGGKASSSTLSDFEVVRTVGTGWYGRVSLVRHRLRGTHHALKILDKETIIRLSQVEHAHNEKRILQAIKFPLCVELEEYFKDNSNLYLLMPFVPGGELFTYLRREGRFEEQLARFYAAQVVLVLEYLHSVKVVYRDLKPENILLDKDGYIKVTDFGFSKVVEERTFTMCGTPEYFAPEMILQQGYGTSVDWWSLGVFLFEMCAGYSPFYSANPYSDSIFRRITSASFSCPSYFSPELKEVVRGLLEGVAWKRLKARELRERPWFRPVLWSAVLEKQFKPPLIPSFQGEGDSSNYETYEERPITVSSVEEFPEIFADF